MKLRCVIVDDEPLAIGVLEGLLKKIPNIEVVATFNDAITVLEKLNELAFDFLFLDVEMPNLTGIDFLKTLSHPPLVIITSANKNYAIEGFELNVIDYILKPVTFERVVKAVNKIVEAKAEKSKHLPDDSSDFIYLKENKRMVRVKLDDIKFLESVKDYVKVVTNEKTVVTKQNLSFFEEMLCKGNFVRIHRSFIVSIKHIDAFSFSSVEIGDQEIPFGRLYKDEALKRLGSSSDSE